jgi:hypothetical protein
MNENFVIFEKISVQLTPENILTQMGYPCSTSPSNGIQKKISSELREAAARIEPKGAYLYLEDTSAKGLDLFHPTESFALAIATIGPDLESYARNLIDTGHGATGLIVDAIGTVAAEQTADFVENRIREDLTGQGWKVSRRYAPGYCGWDLKAQRDLLGFFPNTLSIKLTEACLMLPEKSLSFVCLLNKTGDFSNIKLGNCKRCKQDNCLYRRQPYEKKL